MEGKHDDGNRNSIIIIIINYNGNTTNVQHACL
jgi:hypothetical protein